MNKKFKNLLLVAVCTLGLTACSSNSDTPKDMSELTPEDFPVATITFQDLGTVEVELYPNMAPNTVENFISLANDGFYEGLIMHRVIEGFMIQGGDPNSNGSGGPGYSIVGEFTNNGFEGNTLSHDKGVISMARPGDLDGAGSQFFIMTEDNHGLDGEYAGFGKVTSGIEIIENIGSVETNESDRPVTDVVIESITIDTKGFEYDAPETVK